MRYFRYKNEKKTEKVAWKAYYNDLTRDEKKVFRKEQGLIFLSVVVFYVVSVLGIGGVSFVLGKIFASGTTLATVLKYVLLIPFSILSLFVGGLCGTKISDKIDAPKRRPGRDHLRQACAHLREYYQLQEPYVVTKCYDSSDDRFANKDVCLFVARGELRITIDLNRGFLYGKKDLGCYAFTAEEITLTKVQKEQRLIVKLEAADTVFRLGYQAKSFIENHFISKEKGV